MIDFAKITAIGGNGGNGIGSFTHIKGKRRGKADGGDGGAGGNVFIAVSAHLNTLEPFRYIKEYKAQRGTVGASKNRKGAVGEDLEVKVPIGTIVSITSGSSSVGYSRTLETDLPDYDLDEVGQRVLIARGGEGGRGNAHLRDEFGRRPLKGELGEEGEAVEITLELKLIADIGLVGLPNAGKSTLLSKLTAATPEIANYPFTTLEPNLGVSLGKRIVIADIPGLIAGASVGRGLGHQFLRHIERTKMILHLIDVYTGDVWENYQVVRTELSDYSKELSKKKEIVVLSKIDLVGEDQLKEAIEIFKKRRKKVVAISAESGQGMEELQKLLSV